MLLRDVTERKVSEEKLRENEAHYRLLTEDVRDVVWKLNRDLIVTYISPADEALRGYPANEVIGHHIFEMFSEEGIQAITKLIQLRSENAARGVVSGEVTFEVEHRCKDGRWLWGEVFSKPEFDADGSVVGFHGITREVTRRRQLEDEIRNLAYFDPLTGLCNRRLMNDRLSQVMAASEREGN